MERYNELLTKFPGSIYRVRIAPAGSVNFAVTITINKWPNHLIIFVSGSDLSLINFGETSEFEILEIMADGNCKLKDVHTLEHYELQELIRYGKGRIST